MSWSALSQLMWGISDICFAAYDCLQKQEQSNAAAAADAVVASGGVGSFRWAAVPHAHARAFKAAYPKAYPAEMFFKIFSKYERSDPEAYRFLTPFALNLCEAVEAYDDSCTVFVSCSTWN